MVNVMQMVRRGTLAALALAPILIGIRTIGMAGPPAPTIPTFSTQTDAQKHCPQDAVVWLDSDAGTYYVQTDRSYGQTQPGAYVCKKDADEAGYRPAGRADKNAQLEAAPSPTPTIGSAIFPTRVTFADQDRMYQCGGSVQLAISTRAFESNGEFKVTQSWSGLEKPIAPSSFLTLLDPNGDVLIAGFFDAGGALKALPKPILSLPLQPSAGFKAEVPLADGSTYERVWAGSSTVDVPYGHFDVELYTDRFSRATETDAFADGIGPVQYTVVFKANQAIVTCRLATVTPK